MASRKKIGVPWPEFNDGLSYNDVVRSSDAGLFSTDAVYAYYLNSILLLFIYFCSLHSGLTVIGFYSSKYKSSAPLQG